MLIINIINYKLCIVNYIIIININMNVLFIDYINNILSRININVYIMIIL